MCYEILPVQIETPGAALDRYQMGARTFTCILMQTRGRPMRAFRSGGGGALIEMQSVYFGWDCVRCIYVCLSIWLCDHN